jgi:signal transduction histidine kinase
VESYSLSSEVVSGAELARRVLTYVRIRWYAVLTLSLAAVLTNLGNADILDTLVTVTRFLVLVSAANILFWLAVRLGRQRQAGNGYFIALAFLQLAFDIVIYSLGVLVGGGTDSNLALLFILPILTAGSLFGRRSAYLTGLLAALCYFAAAAAAELRPGLSDITYYADIRRAAFHASILIVYAFVSDFLYVWRRQDEASRAQTEMVSLASHQLRTPATAVKGFLSLLLEGGLGPLKPEQRSFVKQAIDENEQQLQLIDNILNVARIDLKSLHFHPTETDIGGLVDEVVEEHRSILKESEQTITLRDTPKPIRAEVDRQLIRIVIDNLISNARKFSGRGGMITAHVSETDGEVRISVEDNGVGISRIDQKLLFRRFSRVQRNDQTASTGGSGLGLYIAKELVRLHRGRIDLTSYPNEGTIFTITIPKKVAEP